MKRFINDFTLFMITLIVGMMSVMVPSVACAATTRQEALISHNNTVIPKGQTVEDVLVLGHDVTVAGDVSRILVVIDGNIHLTSTSRTDIVVDLGGVIQEDSGALVNALYHAPLVTPFWNGALFGGTLLLLVWAGMLAVSIGFVILSGLICLGFRSRVDAPVQLIQQSVSRVGMTGVLMTLLVLAISALGAVTIIGLPVTAFLLILYALVGVVGFSFVSLWIGKLTMRNSSKDRPAWMLSSIGSSLIMTFTNVPFVGYLLFCIFWLIGVGTITAWTSELWKMRKGRRERGEV